MDFCPDRCVSDGTFAERLQTPVGRRTAHLFSVDIVPADRLTATKGRGELVVPAAAFAHATPRLRVPQYIGDGKEHHP